VLRVLLAAAALFACYFPAALFLKQSHVDGPVAGLKPLNVYRTKTEGIYAASVWAPLNVSKVVVYEDGIEIDTATRVVDHPKWTWIFVGWRWKVIEFRLNHDPVGHAYHGRPLALAKDNPARD
jgi:hypothetical protein